MSSKQIEYTLSCISLSKQLQYENYQVLSSIQALAGAVTPNLVAVTLRCAEAAVNLEFFIEKDSQLDRDLIEDVATDLEALQFTNVSINTAITIVGPYFKPTLSYGRTIFLRHKGCHAG